MGLPTYREIDKFDPVTIYTMTNEEPEIFNRLLGRKRVGKAAAVCSGGDILLGVILPRAEEVVAVDHSTGSIAAALMKAALLEQNGAKRLQDLLLMGSYEKDLFPLLQAAHDTLPEELKVKTKLKQTGYGDPLHYHTPAFKNEWAAFRKEWFYMGAPALERSRRKLDKVTVLHGDVMDTAPHGPFEMLYTSNAHEHTGRNHKVPLLTDFATLLVEGGLLLVTTGHGAVKQAYKGLTLVKELQGLRTSWDYRIYQKNAIAAGA